MHKPHITTYKCKGCDKDFTYNRYAKHRLYCSKECGCRKYSKDHLRKVKVCLYCKKVIEDLKRRRYCSDNCFALATGRLMEDLIKNCSYCHKEFKAKQRNQIFCSFKCKDRLHNRNKSEGQRLRIEIGKCEVCGFSISEGLEAHHISPTEYVILCGSCHNIWHKISKDKYSLRTFLIDSIKDKLNKYNDYRLHPAYISLNNSD